MLIEVHRFLGCCITRRCVYIELFCLVLSPVDETVVELKRLSDYWYPTDLQVLLWSASSGTTVFAPSHYRW
jgi:hypothetical protein